jgi:DNA polymerase III alpha subunit
VLAPVLERSADPSNPVEAFPLARRLRKLFPDRLYLEIAYHGHPREKLLNRALMALCHRFDLPLVATWVTCRMSPSTCCVGSRWGSQSVIQSIGPSIRELAP